MNKSREIAEKYVYGNHDALTDNQEIEDMIIDIENFALSKIDLYKRLLKNELPQNKFIYDIIDGVKL